MGVMARGPVRPLSVSLCGCVCVLELCPQGDRPKIKGQGIFNITEPTKLCNLVSQLRMYYSTAIG